MKKLLSVFTVLFFVGYIGYQVLGNLTEQIETIDALTVEVEDKVTCRGVFVRQMTPVSGGQGSTYEFLVENGEKVSEGQTIAACFGSTQEAEQFRQAAALQKDIEIVEQALKTMKGDEGGTKLDNAAFDNMKAISGKLARGRLSDCEDNYISLHQAVVARDYPREDVAGLEETVKSMTEQLASYSGVGRSAYNLKALTAGYYVKAVRSLPTACRVEDMDSLTPEDVDRLYETDPPKQADGVVGYIIDSFEWYYVCTMSSQEALNIESRGSAVISFPYMTSERVEAKVKKVTYFDDRAVVIFACGYMDKEFLGGGAEIADIIKNTYTGIRLPAEALHMSDGQWGVYCLSGAVVKFKPVEWIYQGDTFYLAKPAESAKDGLYLYDKIVVKGKKLEANMIIK